MLYTFTRPISGEKISDLSCGVTISKRVPRGVMSDFLGVKVAALPPIGQNDRAALSAELGQLRAIFIIKIRDRGARRIGAAAFKQHSLGGEIFVHRLVIVEVVARQVGEHGDVKRHAEHALLRQRVRRNFHDCFGRALAQRLIEKRASSSASGVVCGAG